MVRIVKNVKISEEFYKFVMKKKHGKESFEDILRRIIQIREVNPSKTKKLVLIGDAGVGKSTIRETFFGFDEPQELLKNSLEPTRGIEHFSYTYFDMKVGIMDTAGQEIHQWLNVESERVFSGADHVIYVVDSSQFFKNQKEIYDILYQIINILKIQSPNAIVSLFSHKCDLIPDLDFNDFRDEVIDYHKTFQINERTDVPLFFTSIKERYIKWLNFAFMNIFYVESEALPRYYGFLDLYTL